MTEASPFRLEPVILCGGSGTRLWPLSRDSYPKQFHRFLGEFSLFEATVQRAAGLPGVKSMTVVCNEAHRFMAAQQASAVLSKLNHVVALNIVLEPVARNTAPAIAAAAFTLEPDAIMVVLPADHLMTDTEAFYRASQAAKQAVKLGKLCTFGIRPRSPETGYGYIETGAAVAGMGHGMYAYGVKRFVEKPDLPTAQTLLDTGTHVWNSGMFVMLAGDFISELLQHSPAVHNATLQAIQNAVVDADFTRLSKSHFEQSPSISVDYAVFERTNRAVVIPYNGDWSDLGSWAAVAELASAHPIEPSAPQVTVNAVRNHIHANKPVALIGVNDLVVVDTPDALLVTHKASSQYVKEALAQLKHTHPNLGAYHRKVYAPWGWYDTVDTGHLRNGFQVKRIHVYPGHRLSLQSHQYRAEHWVVVEGVATIAVGADLASTVEQTYSAGEYVYIACQAVHRLSNLTEHRLEVIEVQCGTYLGEDDIVRYEDVYGRT
jgi:mannose-1-phosphate guanylyltransferase/mannose-6-phosphate isomerase